jgi:hypothetical protein
MLVALSELQVLHTDWDDFHTLAAVEGNNPMTRRS